MLFFNLQPPHRKAEYEQYLKLAGCLSRLFSDAAIPYLYYRLAEKVFCRAFDADDLSRSDVSVDAKKETIGIGLKTFITPPTASFQKIAEFNHDRYTYETLSADALIHRIATLRNARIEFTKKAHSLDTLIYHCVGRVSGKFLLFEEEMAPIDCHNIRGIKVRKGSISFTDGQHDYSFLLSKSTLTKRFVTHPILHELHVDILKDPLLELHKILTGTGHPYEKKAPIQQTIYLPLYGRNHTVFEKSGLNAWHAGGRSRHHNEVYIPIPASITQRFPDFFPGRDTPFDLQLPNGNTMRSKICQDGGKALMSCSNRELGEWLLRDVLSLPIGELLTYDRLQTVGIDAVRIDKRNHTTFEINFASVGSYDRFNPPGNTSQ